MSVLFSDAFTRANEAALASPWTFLTSMGTFALVSNKVQCEADLDSVVYVSTLSAIGDQWAQAVVTQTSAGGGGIALRCSSSVQDCLFAVIEGTFGASATLNVYEINGGVYNALGSSPYTVSFSSGNTLYMQILSGSITVKKGTASDGSGGTTLASGITYSGDIATGRQGMFGFPSGTLSNITWDDFVAGDDPGGGGGGGGAVGFGGLLAGARNRMVIA